MSDKKAKKAETEETTADAGPKAAPEAASEAAANSGTEPAEGSPAVDSLMPGLADAVDAALNDAGRGDAEKIVAGILAEIEAERDQAKDKMLRALAESENIRRRAERDRKDAEAYGGTRLARDLLAVHDNLDRALSHVDDATRAQAKGFIEGVELTQRELLSAFAKHRIEKISPAMGEKFDPNRHQAMFEAPIPGADPGTVIEVMQAGFTISDRLLRPALVGVAKAMPKAASDPEPESAGDEQAEVAPGGDE